MCHHDAKSEIRQKVTSFFTKNHLHYFSQLQLKSVTRLVKLKEYERKYYKHYYVHYYYPLHNTIRLETQDGFGIVWHRLFLFRMI